MVDGITVEKGSLAYLNQYVNYLAENVTNLRPLFEILSSDFYKDEKRIFTLKGPGKYEDLSEKYAEQKRKKYGFKYPILFASGKLAKSLLSRSSFGSVNIIKDKNFEIGTGIPYGIYHHSEKPRTKLPRRPLWFLDPERNTALGKRWGRTIDVYYQKILDGKFS